MECVHCPNLNCLIKKNMVRSAVAEKALHKRTMRVAKNTQFIMEGTLVQGLFFIYSGIIKVSKTGINAKEQIVRFSKEGEVVGYRGFGSSAEYQIGSTTIEDSILCFFSTQTLEELFQAVPSFTYDFMNFYAAELSISETKVRKFAQMTVREKVIDAILYMNRKFGHNEKFLNLQLSRKDVAAFAGTTEEQVIRMISGLTKEKLLRKKGKEVGIVDLEKLKLEISEHNFFLSS